MDNTILVSVYMITYNQEKYIAQAIESVLIQKTTFPVKIFIGDDCSTDNTKNICLKYQIENPEKIVLFSNKNNIGAMPNALQTFDACFASGAKYIAMLEGDDYWTEPYKLQKQVDFLENNKEYVLCFHNAEAINEGEIKNNWTFKNRFSRIYNKKDNFDFDDIIINGWFIPTASMVYRNVIKKFPEWMSSVISDDYSLQMLLARKGKLKYIDEIMSVYRLHDSNSRSLFTELSLNQAYIKQTKIFLNTVNGWHKGKFNKMLFFLYIKRIKLLYKSNNKIEYSLLPVTIKYFLITAIYYSLFYKKYRH